MRSPSKGLILSTQNVFVIVVKKKRFRSFQEFDVTEVMYLIGRFMTNFMSHKVLRASRQVFILKSRKWCLLSTGWRFLEIVLGINGLAIFGDDAWYQRVGNFWKWCLVSTGWQFLEVALGINGLAIVGGGSTRDFLIRPFIF